MPSDESPTEGQEPPLAPLEVLGKLADSVAAATEESAAARAASLLAAAQLAEEKLWRGRAFMLAMIALAGYLVILVVFGTVGFLDLHHQSTLLHKVAVDPKSCTAKSETIGCQERLALLAIEAATGAGAQAQSARTVQAIISQVVNQTDCRVRVDLADALHAALPQSVFVFPATATCPAYTP
jgi:hypothetical protein